MTLIIKEYKTINKIKGPLIFVKNTHRVSYGELVEVNFKGGKKRGSVLETSKEYVVIQLFEGTYSVSKKNSVKFLGESIFVRVKESMKGRIFNGSGYSIDKGPKLNGKKLPIEGCAINPYSRDLPNDFIQTGISAIDMMGTLVRGQKLPIFSVAGLEHNDLALQIAKQAKTIGKNEKFLTIFVGMGITNEESLKFQNDFEESGAIKNSILFLNKADDPSVERIMTPRVALTVAEHFAFELDYHVLVIMSDITNYCESLREIGAAREEIPGRRGYPGYMYTDLAQLYERAGRIKGKKGSLTQLPILTMPSGDKTHPIPDLTGYITEGQITLDAQFKQKNIYPQINVLTCLSRLMPIVAGKKTREDHKKVADQLYALYAEGIDLKGLVAIVGKEALNERDLRKLEFVDLFEEKFLNQGKNENREFSKTLNIAWELLRTIPQEELTKIDKKLRAKYY